uniref:Uncharacterized protein n=1 Tax=Klebsiella pneumoniae TaxID=573 RepID=A0A2P1BNE2_KLEPN|nr:hypothetical protein [Klebsiella pneumoniae]
MGMNPARHAEIRQSQLNSLWGWALVASVVYAYWIPVVFREYSVCLCRHGPGPAVGQSAVRYYTLPAAGLLVIWIPCRPPATAWPEWACSPPAGCFVAHSMHRNGWCTGCWALMVLLMNMHDVSESVAGLAIALLTLMVCSSSGERETFLAAAFLRNVLCCGGTGYCRLNVNAGAGRVIPFRYSSSY